MPDKRATTVRGSIVDPPPLEGYEVEYDRRHAPRRRTPTEPTTVADERRKGDRRRRKAGFAALIGTIFGTTKDHGENALALADSIRAGLTSKVWSNLRGIGYTSPELAAVVGVSEKTLSRKQSSRELLDVVQGDRTVRLAQITLDATRAFGDLDKALHWLRKPNRVLAGERPIELIATEPGAALVRRVLGTIEYGGLA